MCRVMKTKHNPEQNWNDEEETNTVDILFSDADNGPGSQKRVDYIRYAP